MKIYVVTKSTIDGEPYPIDAYKEEANAWEAIKDKSNEIVSYDVHEVYFHL